VSAKVDGATGAVLGADSPILLESRGALDRRLVGTSGLEEGVGAAVDLGRADGARTGGRVVAAEGLDDVELDQRALGPAVEGEVPVAVGLDVGIVGDGAVVLLVWFSCGRKMKRSYRAEAGFQPIPETMLPEASVHSRE
jgi:hypothetical protein